MTYYKNFQHEWSHFVCVIQVQTWNCHWYCHLENLELWSVIRFLCAKGETIAEIHCQLCAIYGFDAIPECSVRLWVSRLRNKKQTLTTRQEVVGRMRQQMMGAVFHIIESNHRFMIDDIQHALESEHCINFSFRSVPLRINTCGGAEVPVFGRFVAGVIDRAVRIISIIKK